MPHLNRKALLLTILVFISISALVMAGCGQKQDAAAPAKAVAGQKAPAGAAPEAEQETPVPSSKPITEERTFYDFEKDLGGWEVPSWAEGETNYVARNAALSNDFASHGTTSMKVDTDFPGGQWTAALVEIQQYLDLSPYRVIRVDLYVPADAPVGLKAKIILTVGDNWKWVEMSRSVPLIPGEWVTITAIIEPGSYDWKRVVPDEMFAEDVRKIAIRIESNRVPKYTGPIYIDNIRVGR